METQVIPLQVEVLRRFGFKKEIRSEDEALRKSEARYYRLRIHERIYLSYDTNDGFVTLEQETDRLNPGDGRPVIDRICLPKPIRNKKDMQLLMNAITYHVYLYS